jgi:hypothetical protein
VIKCGHTSVLLRLYPEDSEEGRRDHKGQSNFLGTRGHNMQTVLILFVLFLLGGRGWDYLAWRYC